MPLPSKRPKRSLIRGIALSAMAAMFMHPGSVLCAQMRLRTEAAGLTLGQMADAAVYFGLGDKAPAPAN